MADKFGAAQRQLIKDTNEGKVAPPPRDRTTSISTAGTSKTVIEGRDERSELYRGLVDVGTKILGRVKEAKDKADFIEGFNKGLDDGYAENQRSPIRDVLFGPSATLRGAQKRIVDNDSRLWFNARMKSLEDDMKAMDEDEYQSELTAQLEATLEEHTDPEIKAQLTAKATQHFETLARNHAQQRQIWIDTANERAVADTMNGAVLSMRAAQQHGDLQAQIAAQEEAEEMFDQPLDMNSEVWLETTNSVIIDNLAKGDDLAYRLAEKKGIVAMMSPTEQRRLESAYAVYDNNNGRKFHVAQQTLEKKIANGSATDADLVAFKQAYPEQGDDLNDIRAHKDEVYAELAEIARQKALTREELLTGDINYAGRTPVEQREAVQAVFNSIANDGLNAQRQEAYESGQYDGPMDQPFSAEERMNYMLDNPMQFAQTWAQHPEVKTPMVQNLMTTMISDIRREDLTEDGVDLLTKRYEALRQFEQLDGGNFHNQFRSEEDASMYAAYSYLVADAGWNPIDAIREMRTVMQREDIDIANYKEVIEDNLSELADDFLDQSPESQAWLGLYNKTPDNEQVFNWELKSRLESALKIYKGDMSKALPAAKAAMRRNGLVSNGQFIPNGRKLQLTGGTLEEYMRGLNANDEMRDQITNSGAGFAPDVDYTSLELSVNPFNPKTVLMHGRHESTGQPITIALNLPQQRSHFSTYGFNSFTGYNPYIADKDERRRAFLRNNKLMRGYTTVGKAIGEATGLSKEVPHEQK